jgi:hypothetical protein
MKLINTQWKDSVSKSAIPGFIVKNPTFGTNSFIVSVPDPTIPARPLDSGKIIFIVLQAIRQFFNYISTGLNKNILIIKAG